MARSRIRFRHALLPFALLTSVCLPSTVAAQITRRVFAEGDIVVPGGPTIPSGTEFTTTTRLSGNQGGTCFSAVTIELGTDVRLATETSCQNGWPAPVSAQIRVVWSSPVEVHGAFEAECGGASSSGSSVAGDGIALSSVVFLSPQEQPPRGEWTATIPAGGTFEVVCASFARGGGLSFRGNAAVSAGFTAGGGRMLRDGSPCGVAMAGSIIRISEFGSIRTHDLQLSVTGAPANAIGFLVFGLENRNLIIPPLDCPLRTDLLVPLFTPVNSSGSASFVVSPPPIGFQARVQFLAATVDPTVGQVWRTSQLIELRL